MHGVRPLWETSTFGTTAHTSRLNMQPRWRQLLNERCTACCHNTSTSTSIFFVFIVVAEWVFVVTGHPRVACGGPALLAQFLFPTLCPTRIQAVDVQSGVQVIKFVLQNPSKPRSEEHTSELQSRFDLVCRLLLEKK